MTSLSYSANRNSSLKLNVTHFDCDFSMSVSPKYLIHVKLKPLNIDAMTIK